MSNVDISGELAESIGDSKVFGGSENIRHGRYKLLIKEVFAEKIEGDQPKRMAFAVFRVLESVPNPISYPGGRPDLDDGNKPNPVDSECALKVNFDGPGAKSAPGNIKAFICGLFGVNPNEISNDDVKKTWRDLARRKDEWVVDPSTVEKVFKKANLAAGMVIALSTFSKEKKKTKLIPDLQLKEYITGMTWSCVSKPGAGENSKELVAQRRAELESNVVEDDDDATSVAAAPAAGQPPASPPPPPAPPPPAPPRVEFAPPPPWIKHPNHPWGSTPDTRWYWDGGTGVKSQAQFMAGK